MIESPSYFHPHLSSSNYLLSLLLLTCSSMLLRLDRIPQWMTSGLSTLVLQVIKVPSTLVTGSDLSGPRS